MAGYKHRKYQTIEQYSHCSFLHSEVNIIGGILCDKWDILGLGLFIIYDNTNLSVAIPLTVVGIK